MPEQITSPSSQVLAGKGDDALKAVNLSKFSEGTIYRCGQGGAFSRYNIHFVGQSLGALTSSRPRAATFRVDPVVRDLSVMSTK